MIGEPVEEFLHTEGLCDDFEIHRPARTTCSFSGPWKGIHLKIQYASDFHLDHGPCPLAPDHIQGDVLVLAGNLHERVPLLGEDLTGLAVAGIPILFVPGDREAMALPWENSSGFLRSLIPEGLAVLDQEEVILFGVRFLGCTFWGDFTWKTERRKDLEGVWSLELLDRHREERAWLLERLSRPFPGPTVVVTHFAPSPLSLPDDMVESAESSLYFTALESMILRYQPALWIHGHAPLSVDYRIWKTRIVSNPFGYLEKDSKMMKNPFFSPEKMVVL